MKSTRWLTVCLALGYGVYLAQMLGPLQMTLDSTGYLSLAAAAADSRGLAELWQAIGGGQTISTGYPAMIAGLERVGLARPSALVGLNCAFVLLALFATYCLGRRAFGLTRHSALVVCLLTLLNSTLVRHGPLVLSDVAFAGLALASLAAMTWQREPGEAFHRSIVPAALLALAATLVRSIGILLFVALAVYIVRAWLQHRPVIREQPLVAARAGIAVVIGLIALLAMSKAVYLDVVFTEFSADVTLAGMLRASVVRIEQLGALTLNVPPGRLAVSRVGAVVGFVVGLASCALLISGVLRQRGLRTTDVFVVAYVAVLLVYPAQPDLRYWIPIAPLLILMLIVEGRWWSAKWRWWGWVVSGVGVGYVAVGLLTMGLTTRTTLSGDRFPDLYSQRDLAPTYRYYLGGEKPPPDGVYDEALRVLRRYGGR